MPAAVDAPSPQLDLGDNAGCAETGEPNSAGDDAGASFALVGEEQGGRGPGRPAGSRNVRDTKMVELIQRQYGSPLDALGKLYRNAGDPVDMWIKLRADAKAKNVPDDDFGLSIKDCIDIIIRAALAALPYLEKKQPVAVEFQSDAQPVVFNFHIGNREIGMTQDRATRILEGTEIEDAEIIDAIAAYEADDER